MSLKNKFFSVITAAFAVAAFGTFASAQDAPAKENVEKQEKWLKDDLTPTIEKAQKGFCNLFFMRNYRL